MATFTAGGRTWVVEIDPWQMKRARQLAGVDLGTLLNDGCKGLTALLSDPVLLAETVYALCKEEADKLSVGDRDFARALAGDAFEQAADAFVQALADFYPSRRRGLLLSLATKGKQYAGHLAAGAADLIAALDPEAIARREVEAARTSVASATTSAGSSASTPPG